MDDRERAAWFLVEWQVALFRAMWFPLIWALGLEAKSVELTAEFPLRMVGTKVEAPTRKRPRRPRTTRAIVPT